MIDKTIDLGVADAIWVRQGLFVKSSKALEQVCAILTDLGYHVEHAVLDADGFVPQHRERMVIVGFREKTAFSFADLKLPAKGTIRLSRILHPEDGTETSEAPFTLDDVASVNPKYVLTDGLWRYLQAYAEKHRAKGNGFGFGMVGPDSVTRTLSARYNKDGSEILVSRGEGLNPRRLTPRECARLMGYPDTFQIPVSDTQAYKQFGNSVAVPMFKAVAAHMVPYLSSVETRSELAAN